MAEKEFTLRTALREPLPRSKRLRSVSGAGGRTGSSIVEVEGGNMPEPRLSHTHENKESLDAIAVTDGGYIELSKTIAVTDPETGDVTTETIIEKVKAGDSDKWAGKDFADWMDQPVRSGDAVEFGTVLADDIHANRHLSVGGIADLNVDVPPQPALEAIPYADIDDTQDESTDETPTAFGLAVLKKQLDYASLDEFQESESYIRGALVKRTDSFGVARGYRFKTAKAAGIWDASKVDPLNVKTLSTPLNILQSDMIAILSMT